MKPEYHKGAEARKNFEDGMKKLLRVPKSEFVKSKPPAKKAPAKKVN
jgi:hypothetical protein